METNAAAAGRPTPLSFNPWAKGRPQPARTSVTLPECGITLDLISLDTLRTAAALEEARALTKAHVDGTPEEPAEPMMIDGQPVSPPELLIQELCYIRQMQPEEQRCGFLWWLGIAVCYEDDYGAVVEATQRLAKAAAKNSKTAPKAPGETGSTTPSSAP